MSGTTTTVVWISCAINCPRPIRQARSGLQARSAAMQKHEHFEELTALAAIGQLSVEEHGELLEHLRGCDGCRRAGDQFNFILDQLPLPEPSANDRDLQQLQGASYRRRF